MFDSAFVNNPKLSVRRVIMARVSWRGVLPGYVETKGEFDHTAEDRITTDR